MSKVLFLAIVVTIIAVTINKAKNTNDPIKRVPI